MKTIDIQAFLQESTIELHVLEQWVERRWIVPADESAHLTLTEVDAARAVFIRDLHGDLGVNDEGIDVVLHLVDQMHGMRRVMTELRSELHAMRGGGSARSGSDE